MDSGFYDLNSIVKSIQMLSQKMELTSLLEAAVEIITETAVAQKCLVYVVNKTGIYYGVSLEGKAQKKLQRLELKQITEQDSPKEIIEKAVNSRTPIFWMKNGIEVELPIPDQQYINERGILSIQCIPSLFKGKVNGVVYIENCLVGEGFIPGQIEVLRLIISQLGISIENALLYENLKSENARRKESEAELKKAREEAEEANRVKDIFLANTTHELKTPLHAIIGISEHLINELGSNLSEPYLSNLTSIFSSGKRLNQLVDDILDYSAIKEGRFTVNIKPTRLNPVIESVVQLLSPLAAARHLEILFTPSPEEYLVLADENRLTQVLVNLVGNAIKFTEGGTVSIDTRNESAEIIIKVRDTGIGIDERIALKVFQPFEKAAESTGGIGLGLSISKHLIELQGGSIQLQSEPGKGSTFLLNIPKADRLLQPEEDKSFDLQNQFIKSNLIKTATETSHPFDRFAKTIVAIDDDPFNQIILKNFFDMSAYTIGFYSDPTEALEAIFEKSKPDLILLDLMMPDITGFDFCRKIRERYSKSELPIIILTARNYESDFLRSFSLGANDYITKPFGRNELLTRVENQIQFSETLSRLESLRRLAEKTGHDLHAKTALKRVIELISENLPFSQIYLLQDNGIVESVACTTDGTLAAKKPNLTGFEKRLEGEKVETICLNNIDEKEPDEIPFQIENDNKINNGHILIGRIEEFEDFIIWVYREPSLSPFNPEEIEYIRNIFSLVSAIKRSLKEFLNDVDLIRQIHFIQSHMDSILCIKAVTPHCKVYLDQRKQNLNGLPANGDDQDTLENFEHWELDISIQNLQIYFDEKRLMRIHRSYMINPGRITDIVRKKQSPDHIVMLRTTSKPDLPLNIGRIYFPRVKASLNSFIKAEEPQKTS